MKKIKFKKLSIQNFLSIGDDIVEIYFQNGLNLITGSNLDNPERKNGIGKSSIIEAYYYALYGNTIRDIKKEFIINNVTKGSGDIQLWFDVETDSSINSYKIARKLKPSKVELWKLGETEEDISKDSIVNTNKYINELIGSNSVLSKSCDILSLTDNTPFMAKKPEDKRKFIEDIFDLSVFGLMLKDLKDEIKDNKAEISISAAKISEITNNVNSLINQRELLKKQIEERDETLNKRKIDLETKIQSTQSQIDSIKIENLDNLNLDIDKLNSILLKIDDKINDEITEKFEISSNITYLIGKIEEIDGVGVSKCDKCLQDIPHTHVDHLKSEKNKYLSTHETLKADLSLKEERIKILRDKKNDIKSRLFSLNDKVRVNSININKVESLQKSISEYCLTMSQITDDLSDKSISLDTFNESIGDAESRLTLENDNHNSLKQICDDLDLCKFILGEEGVKSFIVKRLLGMLNTSIQKYIAQLGMTMRCQFDEYFDDNITNDKGKSISYWNLSGGERRTIDLATSWSFKDIKKKVSGISSNVEFYDEILDNSFDEHGMDLLISAIKDRIEQNNFNVYAISHRKETLKHIDGEIVQIVKENGVTKRILT